MTLVLGTRPEGAVEAGTRNRMAPIVKFFVVCDVLAIVQFSCVEVSFKLLTHGHVWLKFLSCQTRIMPGLILDVLLFHKMIEMWRQPSCSNTVATWSSLTRGFVYVSV